MRGRHKDTWILPLLLAGLIQPNLGQEQQKVDCYNTKAGTIYDYGALTINGLTMQYLELNALQNELRNHGLVVLGFPCNQFGKQEPGTNAEILPGLRYVRPGGGFVPNFQLFQKGDVNGDKEQRIYTFLKNSCPPPLESFGDPKKLFWEPLKVHDIKWNFEKFLVGPDGKPVMRWAHRTNIGTVKSDILKYMREQQNLSMG
ncbi:glutathione peroxidase 3 [Podarcis lilfordi]|uniref:Glutathione peroxidase n=1 Tax=Podarcis lilfordi TaxID=74358 RepID=A0AA35JX51_9SAUR|nr:glutathione peroxidase 3 [Podarcis lilfordi]